MSPHHSEKLLSPHLRSVRSWPSTADDIVQLYNRGIKINGAFQMVNTPVAGEEEDATPQPDAMHELFASIQEAKKQPITDPEFPLVDFVWQTLTVPPAPPPPADDAPPPGDDDPVEPTPGEAATTSFRERLKQLWAKTLEFRAFVDGYRCSKVPELASEYDTGYYERLLDTVPVSHVTVPLVLDTIFEQVCLNSAGEDKKAEIDAQVRQEEIASFLDLNRASLVGHSQLGDGDGGFQGPGAALTLLRHGDEMGLRSSTAGVIQQKVQEAEERVRELQSLPGDDFKSQFPLKKLTEAERGMDRTELYHYTNALAPQLVERQLMLDEFERFAKEGEAEGVLADRTVVEFFGRDTLAQVVSAARLTEPTEKAVHYPDHNVCLVDLLHAVPNERIQEACPQVALPLRPQMADWLLDSCTDDWVSCVTTASTVDYVEPKDQIILSKTAVDAKVAFGGRTLFPADNTLVRTRGQVGGGDTTIFTDSVICGVRGEEEGAITHSLFYGTFDDASAAHARKDEC